MRITSREIYERAITLIEASRNEEAATLIGLALLLPDVSKAEKIRMLKTLTSLLLSLGDLQALKRAKELMKLSGDSTSHLIYASALAVGGYYEKSADYLRKAIKLAEKEGVHEEDLHFLYKSPLKFLDCRYLRKKVNLKAVENELWNFVGKDGWERDADFFAEELIRVGFCRLVRGEVESAKKLVSVLEEKLTPDDPEYSDFIELKNAVNHAKNGELKELLEIKYHPAIPKLLNPILTSLENRNMTADSVFVLQAKTLAMLCIRNNLVARGNYRVWAAAIEIATSESLGEPVEAEDWHDIASFYGVPERKIREAYEKLNSYIEIYRKNQRQRFAAELNIRIIEAKKLLDKSLTLHMHKPQARKVLKLAEEMMARVKDSDNRLLNSLVLLLLNDPALFAASVEVLSWNMVMGKPIDWGDVAKRYRLPKDKEYMVEIAVEKLNELLKGQSWTGEGG